MSADFGVSVVVPVYDGSATLTELSQRLETVLQELGCNYEIILVNDGSADNSWETIQGIVDANAHVVGINLERNFGQHNALLAGIRAAQLDVVVTLDDDLQNPPEQLPRLLEELKLGWDVVYGQPVDKNHGRVRNYAARVIVHSIGLLGGRSAPMVSSFRAFRRRLVESFESYTGPDVSIDGLLTWGTDSFTSVPVEHHARAEGASNYSTVKLVSHALTMVTAFSTKPLRVATTLGFLFTLFGVFVLLFVIGRLIVQGESVPGFPFLASVIAIFAGAQLFSLGVIGEYLARMHVRLMARPSYAIRELRRFPSQGGTVAGCRVLDWDSAYWGFPIATVDSGRLDKAEATAVKRWALQEGVSCVFLLAEADDKVTADAAQEAGFRYVDTRITLTLRRSASRSGDLVTGSGESTGRSFEIRMGKPSESRAIADLACETQRDSRFFFDPCFPRDRTERFYGEWIRRGFESLDRQVHVAIDSGEIVGYLVRRIFSEHHEIELIGVGKAARRKGVGRALVEFACANIPRGGELTSATQGRNVPALSMYEAAGLRVEASQVWYHLWL